MYSFLHLSKFFVVIFLYIHYFKTPMEKLMTSKAEKYNGWAAMLGFVVAIGTYVTTGQIIPGIF